MAELTKERYTVAEVVKLTMEKTGFTKDVAKLLVYQAIADGTLPVWGADGKRVDPRDYGGDSNVH